MSIRVGLFGFGKTGRAVASVLLQSKETCLNWVARRSHRMEHRSVPEFLGVDSDEPGTLVCLSREDIESHLDAHPVDAIVDFSHLDGLETYAEAAARRGIAVVSAISNYGEPQIKRLRGLGRSVPVLWSPNITLGINFLLLAAKVLKNIAPDTDVELLEEHFKTKSEVSGTAKVIARELAMEETDIKSIRAGGIVGRHEILFGFPYQTVRLSHESISREAFGNGALFAVKNLVGRAAGFYRMEDLLRPFLAMETNLSA
nr:dihydrodipicolinate reductase C-terminal domain-containing protein [uncultured Holophaga sp.]